MASEFCEDENWAQEKENETLRMHERITGEEKMLRVLEWIK